MARFLRLQEGWLTVALLAILLFSVTLSIQQAQWSDGLSILTPITLIGLATGIALAKVKGVPRFLLDLVGLEIGLVTVLVAVASVMHDPRLVTIQDRVQDLLARTGAWVSVAVRQDVSDDLVVFILSLAVVCWVLAYSSAYFVFRSRQLWWALVPNGAALLINLSYSLVNLNGYIILFMFSALLLMIRFNLLMQEERWQREKVNYSPALAWGFLWAGSAVSVLLALAMWFVPTTAVNGTLNSMWEKVNQPWVDFQSSMGRLWSQVHGGNQAIGGYASFNKSFTMGGSLNLSDSVALIVKSKERHYWRAITFDQYTGTGWRDTSAETFHVSRLSPLLALDAHQKLDSQDEARKEVTYTVQVVSPKADILWASSRPVSMTTPSRLEVSWRTLNEVYNLDNVYSGTAGTSRNPVPLELRGLFGSVREAQRELRELGNVNPLDETAIQLYSTSKGDEIKQKIDELGKRGISVSFGTSGPNYDINIAAYGEVPVYDDISALRALGSLSRNDQYTVVSMVTQATDTELRKISPGDYDEQWVRARYLPLPATVRQPVRDLARRIVTEAGATNPYDMAKAIETYLRTNYKYSTIIPQPPPGVDSVEWFLFQQKEGYCEYYASSMIVMLRSLGIPARMATGYAPGSYDAASQSFIVKESAAHAWPEVYFPSYGWIEFEPTPSQAVVTHQPGPVVNGTDPVESGTPSAVPTAPQKDPDKGTAGSTDTQGNGAGGPLGRWPWTSVVAVALLAAMLLAALALWLPITPWGRKRQRGANAGFYYSRMLFWSRLLRLGPAVHQTPYEFSEALAREVPGTSFFTRSIARAYVRERYSRAGLNPTERASLLRAWNALRSRLWRTMPARGLRRARVVPRRRR